MYLIADATKIRPKCLSSVVNKRLLHILDATLAYKCLIGNLAFVTYDQTYCYRISNISYFSIGKHFVSTSLET